MGMRALAALLLAGALVVNGLANSIPLGGKTTGELSALYPNLFVPAGVTFSIWGIIYIALTAWAVAQFLPSRREVALEIAPAFALTSVLNGAWLLAWHYQLLGLSVLIMLAFLLLLIRIAWILKGKPYLLPRLAFGIYLGWIAIATIANVTAFLVGMGWEGAGIPAPVWAGFLVVLGGVAAVFTVRRLENPFAGLAVLWALAGIILARWNDYPSIALVAVVMMGIVAFAAARTPGWKAAS